VNIVNNWDIERLIATDSKFASIHEKFGSPPDWTRPQGFISLSQIILEQQLSLASAKAHFLKLSDYLPEFTPQNILKLTDEEMRNCQISRQKALYLRGLSRAVLEGEIEFDKLPELEEPEVRRQLTGIKGIGNWTADIYLMFCMQAKDIFPVGDIAIVNTVRELYDVKTTDEILLIAEKWKPLRSLAAYFFWHYYLSKRGRSYEKNSLPPIPS
jgi:DNA-3-methyladenine glycosylase II